MRIGAEGVAMSFLVTVEQDEDGVWVVDCPALPGCVSQGGTRTEALANIRDAIALCLETRRDLNMPLRIDTELVEVAG
jgi:predicted RNase H-like HicB family nuclease